MLIGLAGLAGSGKDTVAEHLKQPTYAFAQPMKEACRIMFGWSDRHLHGDLKEKIDMTYGISPRQAFQTLGTEWGRELINPKLWLIIAERHIKQHRNLVITDVRFDNEAELIQKHGGIVINIVRPDAMTVNSHKSESGLNPSLINHHIHNNGSLIDLYRKVDQLFKVLES